MGDALTFSPNPALFVDEKHDIYLAESPALNPKPHECVVHMRCNGICGSDLHLWHTGQIGNITVDHGCVLGHEGAGEIIWTGSEVKHLKVGDRVAVEPGCPCENCYQCMSGNYNLCPDVQFSGAPPYHGSIRRYHVHPAKFLHKLPDTLTYADGALLEPLSVLMHAFERSPVALGEATVILGAGPIGLIALALARASGAFPLVVTDVDEGRLKFAKEFVPGTITVKVEMNKAAEQIATAVNDAIEMAGGTQPRVAYECSGVQSSVVTACHIVRRRGEIMVVGIGKPSMNDLPFMLMSQGEIDLKFINRYRNSWPVAMRVLQSGYINLKGLVTHHFKLEDAVEALTTAGDRAKASIKIHIEDDF